MLHRAVCTIRDAAGPNGNEIHVFFESTSVIAPARLLALLSFAWDKPASEIEIYNIWSECELKAQSLGPANHGEAYLFECGHADDPLYCDPNRVLFLVRPAALERLLEAQLMAMASNARSLARHMSRRSVSWPALPPVSEPMPLTSHARRKDDRS